MSREAADLLETLTPPDDSGPLKSEPCCLNCQPKLSKPETRDPKSKTRNPDAASNGLRN